MSDERADDAVGETAAANPCEVCGAPAHYRDGTRCHEHITDDFSPGGEADEAAAEGELDEAPDEVEAEPTPLHEGGDPADFTVDEVAAYLKALEGDGADAERVRILEAEASGKGRVGILGHE